MSNGKNLNKKSFVVTLVKAVKTSDSILLTNFNVI